MVIGFFLGASGGLGLQMLKKQLSTSGDRCFAVYRDHERSMALLELQAAHADRIFLFEADATREDSWPVILDWLKPFDLTLGHVFNALGFLSNPDIKPEKSLRELKQEAMMELFRVNTTPLGMAMKTLQAFIKRDHPFVLGSLSAKVGSLGDNKLGGWYSYRVSKAAHNMLLKCLAIEFERRFPQACLLALHPGTVATSLSKPFSSNVQHQIFSPEESVALLYSILDRASPEQTGLFLNWNGEILPW